MEALLDFFPTGTAEGDTEILDRVFIYATEFREVISPPRSSPHLLVGSKGSGKTAVMAYAKHMLDQQKIPNVLLTPFDIDTSSMSHEKSTGDLARSFYASVLDSIIKRISLDSNSFSLGDMADIRNFAQDTGLLSPSFVERARNFIANAAQEISTIDVNKIANSLTERTRDQIRDAISRIVGRKSFYLFIDDTDQVAQPGTSGHLNRVWALLLAVRKLTHDVSGLRAVVSLRSEVWNRLQRDDFGQRDQTDHFRTLVVRMKSDKEHVGRVIDRRLALAANAAGHPGDGYDLFFDGTDARAPMSREKRLWRDLIIVRTRERPRDAIQLINSLAKTTVKKDEIRITEKTFQDTIPPFSKSLSEQISEEVRPEFPEFLDHLRSLANIEYDRGSFTMSAEAVRDHFKKVLSRYGATINGIKLAQENPESSFLVWSFFYNVGVLNARVSDTREKDGYRHLNPDADYHFVSRARWNDLQACLWEINPSYRDYLIEVQNDSSSRSGLAVKPHPRGNRRGRWN